MEFQILKTINNNIVSCLDSHGREHILMGRGLGFGRKAGQTIGQDQVEKIFSITDEANLERFKELLSRLPRRQVEFCTELIPYACEVLGHSLNESVCYTLCDHICFAIERVKNGMAFTNALHTEVRLFYPREYGVGSYAVSEIARRFQVQLPEDEAASIALHLVNAEYVTSFGITMQVTQALGEMVQLLRTSTEFKMDESSIYFDEFLIHLKFLALSLFSHYEEPVSDNPFFDSVAAALPREYHWAGILTETLEKASGQKLTQQQKAYLAINLHRIHPTK